MRQLVMIAALSVAVAGLTSACATKEWVRQQMGKQETEIGQRIGQVDGRVTEENQRVGQQFEGIGARVSGLEGSVGAANDVARGAVARADQVDGRLTRLWSNRYEARVADTVDVPFGFDRSDLGDRAQTVLAAVVKDLQADPRLTVELIGYTDAKGAREYNYELSHRRAEAVRRFLVDRGVQLSRVRMVGLGPLLDPAMSAEQKRRVTVKVMVDQD